MDLDGLWRVGVVVDIASFVHVAKRKVYSSAARKLRRQRESKAAIRRERGDIPGGGLGVDGRAEAARSRPTRIKASRSRVSPLHPLLSSSPSTFTSPSSTFTMFARSAARQVSSVRQFSSSAARNTNVTVLGAGGGIGQPLCLLLKLDPHVKKLNLYDIRGAPGVAADVSHIDSASEVRVL